MLSLSGKVNIVTKEGRLYVELPENYIKKEASIHEIMKKIKKKEICEPIDFVCQTTEVTASSK